jgi:hypothetical protein
VSNIKVSSYSEAYSVKMTFRDSVTCLNESDFTNKMNVIL